MKRERSGSEAGAKRQARKPWKTVKKRWNHRIRFVPAPLPLRSGSVPASSPWSLNATMIISMSRCQGLLPRKNHQKTRVVYQGQFNLRTKKFTKLLPPKNHHETLGVLTLLWSFQKKKKYVHLPYYVLTNRNFKWIVRDIIKFEIDIIVFIIKILSLEC